MSRSSDAGYDEEGAKGGPEPHASTLAVERCPDPLMWADPDDAFRFVYVNRAATEMFGIGRGAFAAIRLFDWNPALPAALCEEIWNSVRNGGTVRRELTCPAPEGGVLDAELAAVRIEGETGPRMACYFRCTGARKEVERELMEVNQRLRAIVNNCGAVLWSVNPEGVFTLSEGKQLAVLGLRPGEVCGRNVRELYPDLESTHDAIARALQGEEVVTITEVGGRVWESFHDPLRAQDGTIFGVVGVSFDVTERVRAEERLKLSLQQKEVLIKEVHHRVKNNLQMISSLLRLQAMNAEDAASGRMFRESQERIRAIALVHERLYRSEDVAKVNFREYLQVITAELVGLYRPGTACVLESDDHAMPIDMAIPAGLFVNELVANALKYAWRPDERGKLGVRFVTGPSGRRILEVSDNGRGLPDGIEAGPGKTLGWKLIAALAEQLGGALEVTRNGGTRVRVEFLS